jgi:hydroxypyruvate reductase
VNDPTTTTPQQIEFLLDLYRHALAAADPMKVLPPHLPAPPRGRTVVVGVGKAAASMARAVEQHWTGPLSGVVVVPHGASLPLQRIEVVEGSHPIPDHRSVAAGQRLMEAVTGLGPDDLVIALISGGGSALCAMPAPGVSLEEKQAITKALLLSGATITEMNTVRKHLSSIKGGRLAVQASPARVVSLLISDIPGDDPSLIASAPTLADPTTCDDALRVLERYGVEVSEQARAGLSSMRFESPKPGNSRLAGHSHRVLACAQDGLDAAAEAARRQGWQAHVLSDSMEGEARELAKVHAAIATQVQRRNQPVASPCVLLSGGEATVTVKGQGRGGRNTEFALALAIALNGRSGIHAISAGTDGLDGNGDAAGSWVAPNTLLRAPGGVRSALDALGNNDSFSFFKRIDGLVITGPTFTNINDFRAVMVEPE